MRTEAQNKELREFLKVLRQAMRQIKTTGDTRRGLLMVRGWIDRNYK